MLAFTPIDLKKILIVAAVLVAFTVVSVTVHQWWVGREAVLSDQISVLKRGIAARDGKIKQQDQALAQLKQRDSAIVKTIAVAATQLAGAKTELAAARQAIDVDAATHAGLVPIVAVHSLEAKDDSTIASCEHLNRDKDTRIDELLGQIDNQAETRALADTNTTAHAEVLKDTVAILKPPWYKRALGWLDDHVITGGIGVGVGTVIGIMIAKK